MKLADAVKRIEELERLVRELQARPAQQIHYHFDYPRPPYHGPTWTYPPVYVPTVWMGTGNDTKTVTTTTFRPGDDVQWVYT